MEPITMLFFTAMAIGNEIRKREREKGERRIKEEEKFISDTSSLLNSSKSSASASQPEIKKKQDTRMCQPKIRLSDNNKFKAE